VRRLARDIRIPAKSTIHSVLHRHGLVKGIRRPRARATGTLLSPGIAPNDLWCADFKGEFKLGNGQYCYPLTVTDHASRYLLLCEALDSVREQPAATSALRSVRQRVQQRAPARGIGDENAQRDVLALGKAYLGLPELTYPLHDRDALVTACGRICMLVVTHKVMHSMRTMHLTRLVKCKQLNSAANTDDLTRGKGQAASIESAALVTQ